MNRRVFYFLTAGVTYLLALTMAAAAGNDPVRAPVAPHRSVITTNAQVSPAPAQGSTAQAGNVGEATCLTCHQDP
jgi:cytochrome c5